MRFFANPEFWVLVAMLILVALLWRPGKRMLIGGLDARAERIGEELATAHRLRDEAEVLLAQFREQERRAAAEAEAIVARARAEAERLAQQAARNLEDALAHRRRLAGERIALEEQKAVAEIRNLAVDVAITAARRVVAAQLDEGRGAVLIDNAIAALPHQLQ
jgi:F-type H+-transporting ATPase subunit b